MSSTAMCPTSRGEGRADSFFTSVCSSSLSNIIKGLYRSQTSQFFCLRRSNGSLTRLLRCIREQLCFPPSLYCGCKGANRFSIHYYSKYESNDSTISLSRAYGGGETLSHDARRPSRVYSNAFACYVT